MNDFLNIIENGTDDPEVLLRAAQWALRTGMTGHEADQIIYMAIDTWGPEQVYMDGEVFA